jgi:hypothetical protein
MHHLLVKCQKFIEPHSLDPFIQFYLGFLKFIGCLLKIFRKIVFFNLYLDFSSMLDFGNYVAPQTHI